MLKSLKRKKQSSSTAKSASKKPKVEARRTLTEEPRAVDSNVPSLDHLVDLPQFKYNAEQDDISPSIGQRH